MLRILKPSIPCGHAIREQNPVIWIVSGAALLLCYAPFLRRMMEQWLTDEDMGHGFVVPAVVAWIVWRERRRWANLAAAPSYLGIAVLGCAAALHYAAAVGAGLFAGSLAFLLSVAGIVISFGGYGLLRALTFPFLLALFMLPKLAVVYNQATLPLQLLASRMTAGTLAAFGFGVMREGNILQINQHRIAVEEACSGIRYLLPLAFLALVYGYAAGSRIWIRTTLLVAAAPLAILANVIRVGASAIRPSIAVNPSLHMVMGICLFALSLAAVAVLNRILSRLHGAKTS